MNVIISPGYESHRNSFLSLLENFETGGTKIDNGRRNVIKIFKAGNLLVNIKSFKKPNLVNKIAYRYFRQSKAKRSFEFAHRLIQMGFYTPTPLAYLETFDAVGLTSSFYLSIQIDPVFTIRDVISDPAWPDGERLIRLYTNLFYNLHEQQVDFTDNSPGNVLIYKQHGDYQLSLVDLNRTSFHKKMNMDYRLANFARLTMDDRVLRIIAVEYAKLAGISFPFALDRIKFHVNKFQEKAERKRKLKKIFKPKPE